VNLLAIDTTTDWCGISFFYEDQCKILIEKSIPKKHSEQLPIFYEEIQKTPMFSQGIIDAIAISIGPGSFTGLRIGLGFAKGLAYALNIPLVPVPTLEVIANDPIIKFDDYFVYLYSHRDIVYFQKFINWKTVNDPRASPWKELDHSQNAVQYGCDNLSNSKNYPSIHPSAAMVGELAIKNYEIWRSNEPYTLASNYISPFEIG
jgi:tRNA threonylcarbamoyl adenosine modification protein YeaZ